MPGVFTLGEASTTAIAEIEKKRTELQEITAIGKNYKSDIDKQTYAKNEENKSFCESAWNDVLKKYEQWFPKSAIGAGTKDRFIEKLLAAHKQDHSNPLLIEELKKKAGVLFGQQPLRMNSYNLIDKSILKSIEEDNIWSKIIVGKKDIDIAGLITKLGNSDWVSKGVEYLEDGNDVCPFCQQHTITPSFRSKLFRNSGILFLVPYTKDFERITQI